MKYRKITRGRKAPSGNGKGKGKGKFKTRYRKMRGGYGHEDRGVTYPDGAKLMSCVAEGSKLGGVYSEHSYDMDRYEAEVNSSIQGKGSSKSSRQYVVDPPPSMFKGSSNGLRTEYVSKRMRMGLFTQSTFYFQRGSLFNIGLIEILKEKPHTGCTNILTCKEAFFARGQDVDVIHDNTAYVFFGGFAKKRGPITYEGVKQGLGLCYNVENAEGNAEGRGRLYMGYWYQDKMNGLGIEVNFGYVYGNPINPVGIYFGHFIQGKRKGYGIYYNVVDGTENFVFYTGNDQCVTSASYQGTDEKEELFKTTVRASLVMNFVDSEGNVTPTRNARNVTLKVYLDRLRTEFTKFIDTMGGMIKKMSDEDKLTARDKFQPVYTAFVTFCFNSVYDVVREAYVAVKDKDAIAQQKLDDAEAARQAARALLTTEEGIVITDKKEEEKKQEEIGKCVTMLKDASYDVKSPEEKAKEKADIEAKKLEEHAELKGKAKELKKLLQQDAFMQKLHSQSGYNDNASHFLQHAVVPLSATLSRGNHQLGMSQSPLRLPVARKLKNSLDAEANDAAPLLDGSQQRSSRSSSRLSSRASTGGGKRTRKNMRMRRVKSRKSRRGGGRLTVMQ